MGEYDQSEIVRDSGVAFVKPVDFERRNALRLQIGQDSVRLQLLWDSAYDYAEVTLLFEGVGVKADFFGSQEPCQLSVIV